MPAADMLVDVRGTDDDLKGLELYKVVDKRLDCAENNAADSIYVGYVGAQYWNSYRYPATVYTTDEIFFTNITTPGTDLLIDKKWWIDYTIKVTINNIPGTSNANQTLFHDDPAFMFRPYPLHQTTNCIQVNLNGRNIQSYPMESLNQRMEFWPQDKLKLSCGCCPHRKYNGQTLGDCSIRKGNAPMGDMNEFPDQDFPNSTIIDVIECKQVNPVVDSTSNFERTAPFKALKFPGGSYTFSHTAGDALPGNNLATVTYVYMVRRRAFAKWISDSANGYNGAVYIGDIMTAKNAFKNSTQYKDLFSIDTTQALTDVSEAFLVQTLTWMDMDFLTTTDLGVLRNGKFMEMEYETDAQGNFTTTKTTTLKEYWSGAYCRQPGSFSLTVRIREPIIADPLDYTSSADFGRTIWHLKDIELRYTFNNHMKNMLAFDKMKLQKNFEWYWAYETIKGLYEGKEQNLISDSNVTIEFTEIPRLCFNVATPFESPTRSFISAHKQYQRFESHLTSRMNADNIDRKDYISPINAPKITAVSDVYPLQFHPNAVYIWVGERNTNRYSSPNRYYHIDSYAKITGLRITYGNTSNIMAQFDDHELFQMSLRNGLQDRSYLDWNAGPKSICTNTEYNGYKYFFGIGAQSPYIKSIVNSAGAVTDFYYEKLDADKLITYNRYAGIGSMLKLIPGIDILTGDATNPLIAGMATSAMTFKVEVDFVPLNINESIDYSLYVMFEYDGICTISKEQKHQCDLGMIAIDSWTQLKSANKLRVPRETEYMVGLTGAAMRHGRSIRNYASNLGIARRAMGAGRGGSSSYSGGAINNHPGLAPKMSGGRIINPRDLNGGNFYTSY